MGLPCGRADFALPRSEEGPDPRPGKHAIGLDDKNNAPGLAAIASRPATASTNRIHREAAAAPQTPPTSPQVRKNSAATRPSPATANPGAQINPAARNPCKTPDWRPIPWYAWKIPLLFQTPPACWGRSQRNISSTRLSHAAAQSPPPEPSQSLTPACHLGPNTQRRRRRTPHGRWRIPPAPPLQTAPRRRRGGRVGAA